MTKEKSTPAPKESAETISSNGEEASAAAEPAAEENDFQQQLAAAQQEAAEQKENYMRAAAELENVRRRSEKKIADVHQYALTDFALAIGEVRDCLETALDTAAAKQYEKLHEGVSLTLRKLVSAMDMRYILPIKPDIGAAFDPSIHMAIGRAPVSEHAAADTVAVLVQAGYMLNGRVIRAANVMVAADTTDAPETTTPAGKTAAASANHSKKD